MPPLHSGDTGDGQGDEERDGDDVEFRPPLPQDDRLWRHPSEVAFDVPSTGRSVAVGAPSVAPPAGAGRIAALMLASGLIGATLAVGAVAALGGFGERVVERRVAVPPVTVRAPTGGALDTVSRNGSVDQVALVAARTGPAVAALIVDRGDEVVDGSAVIVRSDGYLLTNAHLVTGADRIRVVLHGGPAGSARLVGTDPVTDLAVIHVDGDDLVAAAFGSADDLVTGSRTVAVGATADGGWGSAVSTGVVSAMGRRLQAPDGTVLHDMILVDAPFLRGAAGGALVDTTGAVVGITSGIPASGAGDVSFGVATPIDLARLIADQLIDTGRAQHVWLGVHGADLDPDVAHLKGLPGAAQVADVVADSPAHAAGLQPGDVIVAVDEDPIASMSDLISRLRRHRPGDRIEVQVWRGDDLMTVTVALSAKTDDAAS